MGEIAAELRRLRRQIARTERGLANAELRGQIAEVDDDRRKARVRIDTGADGSAVLSPWLSWSEASNGFTAHHVPMRVGDPVVVRSPSGVLGASSNIERQGYSGAHPAPSTAGDAAVETTGAVTITRRADGLTIAVGGTSWAFSAAGLVQTGGAITHDGHAIDKTHLHGGVEPGGAVSGPPT